MAPYLTPRGKAVLAVTLGWLLLGAILLVSGKPVAAWPMLMAATGLIVLLCMAFFCAVPLSRSLADGLLEVELRPLRNAAAMYTGDWIAPQLVLRNRSGLWVRRLVLQPEMGRALEYTPEDLPETTLPPSGQAELDVPMRAHRSGRWLVHGFHVVCRDALNLFAVANYLPSPQPLTFYPKGVAKRRIPVRPAHALVNERVGPHAVRLRGFGTDLRELREHQQGDPFRNIAWKATARTGKLMVRELESEISLSAYLVVDISATMRGALTHGSKLEHSIKLASGFGHGVMRGSDRCGLITFDEKVYGHLPAKHGAAQMNRITQHLVGASNVVDPGLTEYDEDEVIEALINYLMLQRRLDFRRTSPRRQNASVPAIEDVYDIELLNRWLRAELRLNGPDPQLNVGVLHYANLSLARQYCHLHGIEIPYRTEQRYGTKEQGLIESLEVIMRSSRNPHIILVISDLAGLVDTERLGKVVELALAKKHKLAVLAPYTPSYIARPDADDNPVVAALHELFGAAEARERRAVVRVLHKRGVPVIEVGPGQALASLLKQLRLGL